MGVRPFPAEAQHPDLSGEWHLVKEESRQPDDGRRDGIRTFIPASQMVIVQRGDTVRGEYRAWDYRRGRRSPRDYRHRVIIVDAAPRSVDPSDAFRTAVARWEAETLVVEITKTTSLALGSTRETTRETYALLEGGRKLLVQNWYPDDPFAAPPRARLVYARRGWGEHPAPQCHT